MDDVSEGQQPPLTRREARAREAAMAAGAPNAQVERAPLPGPATIVSSPSLAPVDPLAEAVVGPRRRAMPSPKQSRAHRKASLRADRAARSIRPSTKRRSSVGSKFASLGALGIVGALLVGSSLPVNVLTTNSSASAATETTPGVVAGQTLQASAEAIDSAPVRDNFDVVSYAQVLALKFAGVDYSYSVTSGAVRWPLSSAIPITDGFGPRASGFHKGVDFVPGEGTPVYAIADGVAVSAGYDSSGYGNHVVIRHNLGGIDVKSNYAHMVMDSSPIVAGQQIRVGDFLGLVGNTGISYGAHLHFEIYIDDVPVDPFIWLQANASNV